MDGYLDVAPVVIRSRGECGTFVYTSAAGWQYWITPRHADEVPKHDAHHLHYFRLYLDEAMRRGEID